MRLIWLIREVRIWTNFLRERLGLVSNYEQAKFTRKARGANKFWRCPHFASLLIFAERLDSSSCYFSPQIKDYPHFSHDSAKRTDSIGEMSTPLPEETKKKSLSLGRKTVRLLMEDVIPERNKMQPFCSFSDLLKTGNLVPRMATTSLSGEENQPRLIHETSILVTKMKGNS